ncbi:hypothetical protein TDB9533_01948 [Thalassocella blandensis]|nr:hypothetical protein TDB9533_01948 [Thalassocella blandensis]
MWKFLKLTVGLIVLSGIGLIYGKFNSVVDETKEEKMYSYISFEFPGGEISTVQIKEMPESRCEIVREEYFHASYAQCNECKVLFNECRREKPDLFSKAVSGHKVGIPYIFKPYKFPEVTFFKGFPSEAFPQMCNMEKESLASSVCVQ